MTPGINTLLLSTGALGSFTCSRMTLPIYMGPTALRGIRATGDTLSNVESQVFTPYKFGSTAGDRTPDLLTTRPMCYHSATALCVLTDVYVHDMDDKVNKHILNRKSYHFSIMQSFEEAMAYLCLCTAGDRTPDLLTTRPTCYHSATALCVLTDVYVHDMDDKVNKHILNRKSYHFTALPMLQPPPGHRTSTSH